MPGSERNERLVRRLRPTDRDLGRIVEQINSASMEIDEPFTRDSLTEFLTDDRNVYLTVHLQGELAGTLHAIGLLASATCTWMSSTPTKPFGLLHVLSGLPSAAGGRVPGF